MGGGQCRQQSARQCEGGVERLICDRSLLIRSRADDNSETAGGQAGRAVGVWEGRVVVSAAAGNTAFTTPTSPPTHHDGLGHKTYVT